MSYFLMKPLFPLGTLLLSPGVEALDIDVKRILRRHQCGSGDGCQEDHDANQQAVKNREAIVSEYHLLNPAGQPVLLPVMTEADRSLTVIFLANESTFESIEMDDL